MQLPFYYKEMTDKIDLILNLDLRSCIHKSYRTIKLWYVTPVSICDRHAVINLFSTYYIAWDCIPSLSTSWVFILEFSWERGRLRNAHPPKFLSVETLWNRAGLVIWKQEETSYHELSGEALRAYGLRLYLTLLFSDMLVDCYSAGSAVSSNNLYCKAVHGDCIMDKNYTKLIFEQFPMWE